MNPNVSARTEFECPSQASILSWVKGIPFHTSDKNCNSGGIALHYFVFVFFPSVHNIYVEREE